MRHAACDAGEIGFDVSTGEDAGRCVRSMLFGTGGLPMGRSVPVVPFVASTGKLGTGSFVPG